MALCALAVGCGVFGSGEAACAAIEPRVEAEPAQAAPTETFVLRGEGFADHSGRGLLQGECPRLLPDRAILVELVQGDKTWELARIDSGEEDFAFEARLEVPADATPGEAVVRATSHSIGPSQAVPLPVKGPFLVLGGLQPV